nr:nucleotidyl transferase AbiEii/AbiGii toxin family protein [Finegoldia magna]
MCKLENIRQVVPLDIATGDIITPEPIDYNYSSSFSDEKINIKAYNLETMLAEKIQTIYSRGFFNSRSKDYYDLFIIRKMKMDKIDIELLKESCKNTFKYRNTEFDMDKILVLLEKIKDVLNFQSRWKSFCKKNIYANGLEFENVIDESISLIKLMK